ncbi:secretory pathway Sec39 [Xylona heveae TC161]|uniref:Secretory pathway Sec39 n=1 Tax=Xylona heveae (strain CBS 132557 / TC161) TaxID=1328760 RepID=A0A165GGM2_XYLHT|nr:secretory pathway Sec39 [Xylona heveae TC161]KZF22162.1 secretory pathway Sec39 [Xylona heveae TC161]
MENASGLSEAQAVLLAAHLASESEVTSFWALANSHSQFLPKELLLRLLLTYLPESTSPSNFCWLIQRLVTEEVDSSSEGSFDATPVKGLTESQSRKRVQRLQLLPLACPSYALDDSVDLITRFLICRIHRIDSETGLLAQVPQLLEPFLHHSDELRCWFISRVLPLLRLSYEYYPESYTVFSLSEFEKLSGETAVHNLLSKCGETGAHENIGRDLRNLVGPWMYGSGKNKRRKLNAEHHEDKNNGRPYEPLNDADGAEWKFVFEWLLSTARTTFSLAVDAVQGWDGPGDVDCGGYNEGLGYLDESVQQSLELQYAQTALASVYATDEASPAALEGAYHILVRITELMQLDVPPEVFSPHSSLSRFGDLAGSIRDWSTMLLLQNALLQPKNPLTTPEKNSIKFMEAVLSSANILTKLGETLSLRAIAELILSKSKDQQKKKLQKVLHNLSAGPKRDEGEWAQIVQDLRWLWGWGTEDASQAGYPGQGVFGNVEINFLEREILKLLISKNCNELVVKAYITDSAQRLTKDEVEKVILDSVLNAYDNASNGNRTRGGIKKASDIIRAFQGYFPSSSGFRHANALIAATHSLSFYSLTLQHGVPFQPVAIRVQQDPLTLINKVLDQNPKSYTNLDDLLEISRNFVAAGIIKDGNTIADSAPSGHSTKQQTHNVERRVIGMAIEAALTEDDFETAYSYVITRLNPFSRPAAGTTGDKEINESDSISWRAAFQAGRYRPGRSSAGPEELRNLEQRMELLSQALMLAPPAALSEILGVWRRCEEELTMLLAQESEEETRWDDRGDGKVPGGFIESSGVTRTNRTTAATRRINDEAPMGLFDVAKGAAAALSRSAFPLRGAGAGAMAAASTATPRESSHSRDLSASMISNADSDSVSLAGSEREKRIRKRDVVSNMVTGGLASGIGWVLGATPVNPQEQHHSPEKE